MKQSTGCNDYQTIIDIFARNRKNIKFTWTHTKPQISKLILRKYRPRDTTFSNFKVYYKATVIKVVWF